MAPAFSRADPGVAGPPDAPDPEFDAIETCLTTSERGRRFLAEYARRRQLENSLRIMAAIDRIEARALHAEIDRVRERLEADRIAEVARQLSDVLTELRPVADARERARTVERVSSVGHGQVTPLERRFAALVKLDDAEQRLKLFG